LNGLNGYFIRLWSPRASLWHQVHPWGGILGEHPDKAGDRVEGLNFRLCWGKEGSKRRNNLNKEASDG
jgi:hypothetical protein